MVEVRWQLGANESTLLHAQCSCCASCSTDMHARNVSHAKGIFVHALWIGRTFSSTWKVTGTVATAAAAVGSPPGTVEPPAPLAASATVATTHGRLAHPRRATAGRRKGRKPPALGRARAGAAGGG